jgi:hypothetical protein
MAYLTRLNHFTFSKEGDELVIVSERDDSFEERHDWPDDWSVTDEDLQSKLYDRYYIQLKKSFDS